VQVQVRDRLARGGAGVEADVEAVGLVAPQDLLAGDGEGGEQRELLLGRGAGSRAGRGRCTLSLQPSPGDRVPRLLGVGVEGHVEHSAG
jgi:hypothetical protein